MVYIKRDEQGKIVALINKNSPDTEQLPVEHPEVIEFLSLNEGNERAKFLHSDLQLIRVLEDLIDVLISKNIITITDFPKPVIDKLLARQTIRKRLSGAISMEFEDEH